MKLVIAWLLVLIVVSIAILPHSFVDAKSKSTEQKAIEKALGQVGYKNICKLGVTIKTSPNEGAKVIYDNPKCHIVVPPTCKSNEHLENGVCVPNPPNPPVCNIKEHLENGVCVPDTQPPTTDKTTVCLVGDLSGSTVPNMMKDCNLKIGLGDLGYKSDLSWFKGLNFNKCVIGNHDSPEDGNPSIYNEALAYCGDHWNLNVGGSTLILGFNTNGDIAPQLKDASSVISKQSGLRTIIVVSHKNGHVFTNAHHPAEAANLYKQIESIVPTGVTLYEISGHNHDNAAAPAKNWYIAGTGGKSFYACGTDADWTYCDNTHVGYLELTIDNTNGNTVAKFIK